MNTDYDLVVIGAGISGLSLAHLAARRGRTVLVVEKTERPGGCVRSSAPPGATEGETAPFWIELGAHTLYNSYVNLIDLLENCGLGNRILPRRKLSFLLLVGGQLRSIASQLAIPELLLSVPRLFFTDRAGQSIKSYYSRIVGKHNYERVFEAMFNAVACQDTSEFGVDYLFKKRPSRRKDLPRSFTIEGGLSTLIGALAATPGVTLKTGAAAVAVTRENGRFLVRLADGSLQAARAVAVAAPPDDTATLLAPGFPDLATEVGAIKVNRLYSLGVATKREAVALQPLAGIVSPGDRFFSVVSRDVVPHLSCRGFTFHFRDPDPEAAVRRAAEVLGVGAAAFDRTEAKENTIPTLGVGHAVLVRQIDVTAARHGILLTGNWFNGLSLEDCVARSVDAVGKLEAWLATTKQ